jgi:hypothetical protein
MSFYLITYSVVEEYSVFEAQNQLIHLLLTSGFKGLGKPTSQSILFSGNEDSVNELSMALLKDYASFLYYVISKVDYNTYINPNVDEHNSFLGMLSDASRSLGLDVFQVCSPNIYDPIVD